jgi:hypothetical protein
VHAPRVFAIGRVTRAAVFSAALVACGGKKDEPKPAPAGSAEHLDQDFNQLLGSAEGSAHAVASDAALAVDASQPLDGSAPVDAGLSDEERTRQLQHAQDEQHKKQIETERQRRLEEQRRLQEQQRQDWHNVAKPYGAPPARRRIV